MITIIDTAARQSAPIPEGSVRQILTPASDKTMVEVARYEVAAGRTHRVAPSERTQVVYILEGNGAEVIFTKAGKATVYTANRRSGVYLEPGEEAVFKSSGTPLVLLQVTVPKHTGKPIAPGSAIAHRLFLRGIEIAGAGRRETDSDSDILGQQRDRTFRFLGPADRPHAVWAGSLFAAARAPRVQNEFRPRRNISTSSKPAPAK